MVLVCRENYLTDFDDKKATHSSYEVIALLPEDFFSIAKSMTTQVAPEAQHQTTNAHSLLQSYNWPPEGFTIAMKKLNMHLDGLHLENRRLGPRVV